MGPIFRSIMLLMIPAFGGMGRMQPERRHCSLFSPRPGVLWFTSVQKGKHCACTQSFLLGHTVSCLWFLQNICPTFHKSAKGHNRKEIVLSVQNVTKIPSSFYKLQIHVLEDTARDTQRVPEHWVGLSEGERVLGLRVLQSYVGMLESVCVILTLNYTWQNKMHCLVS